MTNWQELEDVFNRAIDLPEAERVSFVTTHCGQQTDLKQQVLALLKAETQADGFLHSLSEKVYPLMGPLPQGRVAHYRLLDIIGEGGMGTVYKAFDEKLQRTVAIKFLSVIRSQRQKEKERFLQEAKAAARLNHPNVCEVYEVDESDDGYLYIVTAFCEGENLSTLISRHSMNLGQIIDYCVQLCQALDTAHKQKIVHRDIKPANIIVSPEGQVRLVDFGIAKIQGQDISVSNQLIGTFAYMSPEQFSGSSVDQRTDIWSTGIVLFECLTGQRPYKSDQPAEIMYRIFNGNVPQLLDKSLPMLEALNTLLRRCLSVDKQMRFSSMELLANELRAIYRQLESQGQLQWHPQYSEGNKENSSGLPRTLNEYRKVIALGIRLSPQIDEQQTKVIKNCIKQFRGQISNQQPNTWYAYFGFPKLGEGAADNALGCAMALLAIKNQSGNSPPVEQVVMHNTSIVISSDSKTGSQKIHGDIPGAVAELLSLKPPHALLITENANKRLRKPIADNAIWQTTDYIQDALYSFDPTQVIQPIIALENQFKTPLLGRVHELGLLESTWQSVVEGDGRAIMISGDAGIGKSRLVFELKRSHGVRSSNNSIFEYSCDPNHQETALFPIINGLRYYSGLNSSATLPGVTEFLTKHGMKKEENDKLLAWLLGIDEPGLQTFLLSESPESLKYKGFGLLESLVSALARQQPLLIIVEDLHWADSTTVEWLDRVLSKPLSPRVFFLLTGRPELFQRWRSYSTVSQLNLNKLSQTEAGDLVRSFIPDQALDQNFVAEVLQKTEGNPLFIEEYLKMLADSRGSDIKIPERLEDILLSRIDQLGSAKSVAQIAAVIGRRFNLDPLKALMAFSDAELTNCVDQLLAAESIYQVDEEHYLFKHALICDALYESLNIDERQRLHRELAIHLETEAERDNSHTEAVAHHYSKAGQYQRSANWWLQAARLAEVRYANTDVIRLCQRGLSDIAHCHDDAEIKTTAFYLHMTLGKGAMSAKGYANNLAGGSHQQAVQLGRELDLISASFPAMVGLWAYFCVSAQHQKAATLAANMHALAEQQRSDDLRVEAAMCAGVTAMFMGDLPSAKTEFDDAIARYQPTMSPDHIRQYGQDPIVVIDSFYAVVEEALGNIESALACSDRCIANAKAVNHPFSLAFAYGFAVHIRIRQKQLDYAQQLIQENKQLCENHGIHVFQLLGAIQAGILALALGKPDEGIEVLITQIPKYKAMGAEIFLPTWSALLAMTFAQIGNLDMAEKHYKDGWQQMQKSQEWFNQPLLTFVKEQLAATPH